ncbi:MAG: glycoside hydrolase family 3 C-terminal domain-containing protein [Pseudomonadota bacterium]
MSDFSPKTGMTEEEIGATVYLILAEATLEEKVAMMSGQGFFQAMAEDGMRWGGRPYRAGGGLERLGVPALYFTDGPRGVARGESTCFPSTMARGASWDRELERRIGEVMGIEGRAQGCNLSGAVCVNLLRHPGWGRAQETYGEDPFHMGEMGAALARGIQAHNVIATVKHFAVNSIENSRFKVDVRVGERTLREVYLPHFKRILDAGCASVMSAYNKLNGEYCGQHRRLLTDILRHEWGFDGFVHSDWILGVYSAYGASAGLDIENPEPIHFGEKLVAGVKSGAIDPGVVDTACRRILGTLYRFACAEDPIEDYDMDLVASEANVAVAREAAEKSAVLLTNNGLLPLAETASIGVFGSLADAENLGDFGSSRVRPPYSITAREGLSNLLGRPLSVLGDESDTEAAAKAAAGLDAAILVVGTTAEHEGEFIPGDMGAPPPGIPDEMAQALADARENAEPDPAVNRDAGALGGGGDRGGDRTRLRLPEDQIALVHAVAKANPNTIVVIQSGSAIICDWAQDVAAVLHTFYSGMEGGNALADLLFGRVSPSGRLPFSVATDESAYPSFDPTADVADYDELHGYTRMGAHQANVRFAFGHGLSYTTFEHRALSARKVEGGLEVSLSVRNTGEHDGAEIVRIHVGFPNRLVERPVPLLKAFERVELKAGERRTVSLFIAESDLHYWDEATYGWRLEPGRYEVGLGQSLEGSNPHSSIDL